MSAVIDTDGLGTGVARGPFGSRPRRGGFNTPARIALLTELWPSMTPTAEIIAALDALPGKRPVTYIQAAHWAGKLDVRRPQDATKDRVLENWRTKYAMIEPQETTAERDDALRRIASGNWTFERLSGLCTAWIAGHSTAEIGRHLGVTKNAIVGKAHRLIDQGLLTNRESPIIRDGEPREPKPKVIRPKETLPPLPSAIEPPPVAFVPKASTVARFNPAMLPRGGSGPMRYDFRSPRPIVPVIEKPTPRQWVADDGSAATGPSLHPCQFVVRDGSVTEPWIMCNMPSIDRVWCRDHRAICYTRASRAVAA